MPGLILQLTWTTEQREMTKFAIFNAEDHKETIQKLLNIVVMLAA